MTLDQENVLLGQLAGHTVEQIAAEMGRTTVAVHQLLTRAKAKMSPEQRDRYDRMLNRPELATRVSPLQLSVCHGAAA